MKHLADFSSTYPPKKKSHFWRNAGLITLGIGATAAAPFAINAGLATIGKRIIKPKNFKPGVSKNYSQAPTFNAGKTMQVETNLNNPVLSAKRLANTKKVQKNYGKWRAQNSEVQNTRRDMRTMANLAHRGSILESQTKL